MALDALVHTQAPEDATDVDQILLFPVRSALAAVKDAAGAVSVETVLDEIARSCTWPLRINTTGSPFDCHKIKKV
jgi:hypothetical protein